VDFEQQIQQIRQQIQQQIQNQQLQSLQQPLQTQQQLQNWAPAGSASLGLNFCGNAISRRQQARNAKKLASLGLDPNGKKLRKEKKPKKKRGSRLEYKRVDQLWDNTIHNYKLQDTAEDEGK
jgi:hypothetical protein